MFDVSNNETLHRTGLVDILEPCSYSLKVLRSERRVCLAMTGEKGLAMTKKEVKVSPII